jgi:mRNA turnover protein 4
MFNINLISTARIFLGRGAVMAKALGSTIEEEHREGLHKLAEVGPLD